ncbi:NAD-dependent epimerase/dehydratase family protein [Aestuariibius insulae]|uniref:NAD-dependent epimerase/dehydratase family protein n=1 Tax=Aestuariibius insulae TaxID=2058287 RepID=UPI00345F0E78
MGDSLLADRRALVTGATGFTGSHLAHALRAKGYHVRALVRDPDGANAKRLAEGGIELIQGDIGDAEAIDQAVARMTHVFHIAAVYRTANHSDAYYERINRDAVGYVLEAANRHGVERIVHCSTCGVHGDVAEIPANEETAFNPGDVYQRSKLAGEMLAQEAARAGAPVSIVRPTGIYGPGDDRFLKLFRTVENGTFRVFGKGDIAYHLTYIDDMVDGLILAGEHPAAIGEVFLIGDDSYTTLDGLVAEVARAVGVKPPSLHLPVVPLMLAATACEFACRPFGIDPPLHRRRVAFFTKARAFSVDKAKDRLGFQPKVPLADGIARTAEWYRQEGWLKGSGKTAA